MVNANIFSGLTFHCLFQAFFTRENLIRRGRLGVVMELVRSTECISLLKEPALAIGSSFISDIFYQYKNLISSHILDIYFENHECYYRLEENEPVRFKYGEILKLHGLRLMYLGKYLLVYSIDGDMRVATNQKR